MRPRSPGSALGSTAGSPTTQLTLGSGNLTISGTNQATVNPSGILDVNGKTLAAGQVTVDGVLQATTGGTVSAPVTLAGGTLASTGILSLGNTGANSLVVTGTSSVASGTINVAGLTTVNGLLTVNGAMSGSTVTVNGSLTGAGA